MKIKLVIECNPTSSDGEADALFKLFAGLADVANSCGRVKLEEGLRKLSRFYGCDDSIPKDDPKRES